MTKTKISTKQLLIWVALAAIAFTAFGFGGTRGVSFASALIFVLGVFMFLGKKEKMAKGDKKSFFIWVLPFAVFVLLISFGRFWSTYHYDAGAGSIRWFSYFIAALFNVLGVVGYAMVGHCLSLGENSEGKTKERLFEVILCALALHVLINLIITLANYGPFYRTLYAGKSYYYGSVEYPVANERMILDGFTIATVSTQYGDISSFLLAATLPSLLFISLKENKIGFSIAAVSGGIGLLDLVLMPNHLALLLLIPVFSIAVFVRFVKTGTKTPLWEKIVGFAMLAMVAIVVFLMIGVAANGNNNYGPLSKIFNRCDDATIEKVEKALKEAMGSTVYGLEVDEGKDDIVRGVYHANLAWSGDSVYSMDSAEEGSEKILNYSLPTEGSNVWFDGWCMPKGANKELAEEFVNYICMPEVAANCMDAVGYTSPIVGDAMWDLVNEWYAADKDEEETYTVDLSFYFGDSIDGKAEIKIPTSEKGRQFDAQYPTEEMLNRCCVMKDFGSQTEKVEAMWIRVNA